MDELLFSRGNNKRVVVATSNIHDVEGSESLKDDIITKKMLESVFYRINFRFAEVLRVNVYFNGKCI